MMDVLLQPFSYGYMFNAMWVSALVGGVCAFLSSYLMLKGWSLIGDALSHSVVPGVAGAYMLGLPFALGAFISGGLAAAAMPNDPALLPLAVIPPGGLGAPLILRLLEVVNQREMRALFTAAPSWRIAASIPPLWVAEAAPVADPV